MQTKPEGWSIVLAGYWNRMIFTPEWVGSRLFPDNPQIETVVALLPVLPIVYRTALVAVEISSTRIVCRARDLSSDESLQQSEDIARKIISELPETPLQGIGVNFGFRESKPPPALLDLFIFNDTSQLTTAGWEATERRIIRQLQYESTTLNLNLSLNSGQLDIDCNFHFDPPVSDEGATTEKVLEPIQVIPLRNQVISFLESIYCLQLEGEEYDDQV